MYIAFNFSNLFDIRTGVPIQYACCAWLDKMCYIEIGVDNEI